MHIIYKEYYIYYGNYQGTFLCLCVDNCLRIKEVWVTVFFCYTSFDKEFTTKLTQGLKYLKANNIQKELKETS